MAWGYGERPRSSGEQSVALFSALLLASGRATLADTARFCSRKSADPDLAGKVRMLGCRDRRASVCVDLWRQLMSRRVLRAKPMTASMAVQAIRAAAPAPGGRR
jgi:hypothetical protein